MKRIKEVSILIVVLILVACQRTGEPNHTVSQQVRAEAFVKNHLSPEKMKMAEKLAHSQEQDEKTLGIAETCAHLAGEFGGEQSDRDKEITQQQDELQCDNAIEKLKELKARTPNGSPLTIRINETLAIFE